MIGMIHEIPEPETWKAHKKREGECYKNRTNHCLSIIDEVINIVIRPEYLYSNRHCFIAHFWHVTLFIVKRKIVASAEAK
jgi:hypothetical protein